MTADVAVTLESPPSSRWRRLLARVSGWQAPPRNLLLSALVLLVFPWDDILIDALYGGNPRLPTLVVYGAWSLFDFSVIWVLLASGRLVRPAFVYGAITVALDAMLAAVYLGLTQYTGAYIIATAALRVAYLVLITTVMWVRLSHGPSRTGWFGRWFGAGQARANGTAPVHVRRSATRLDRGRLRRHVLRVAHLRGTRTAARLRRLRPADRPSFFAEAAHIVAILLVALAIEARLLVDRSGPEERALVGVTMLGLAVGIATSLTAGAADSETLPLVFPLTVQALAIGVTTTLMLPFLRFSRDGQ